MTAHYSHVVGTRTQAFRDILYQLRTRSGGTPQARRHYGNAQVLTHGLIVGGTEDDSCVVGGIDADGVHDFAGFAHFQCAACRDIDQRSEVHTSELQSLMRISYAVFCLEKKNTNQRTY